MQHYNLRNPNDLACEENTFSRYGFRKWIKFMLCVGIYCMANSFFVTMSFMKLYLVFICFNLLLYFASLVNEIAA